MNHGDLVMTADEHLAWVLEASETVVAVRFANTEVTGRYAPIQLVRIATGEAVERARREPAGLREALERDHRARVTAANAAHKEA